MTHALVSIPDVYESVTRRVAVDVMSQLARIMRLPENTQVMLPGKSEVIPLNGGTFGECSAVGIKYPGEDRLLVRFIEEANDDIALATAVNNTQNYPVFEDPVRDVILRPTYRYVKVTATIEYKARNIVIAQRWIEEMRARVSMMRAELYQKVIYHFGMPKPIQGLLTHIHEVMEDSDYPTGDTLEEYLGKYFTIPTKEVATLIGTHPITVFPEHQYEVLGWFDFTTTPPEPERDLVGTYVTSFSYTFNYNRPEKLWCRYPLLVHNRPIRKDYRQDRPIEHPRVHLRRVSGLKASMDTFLSKLSLKGLPYVHYPRTDDWTPPEESTETLTFFTGLLMLDPLDPTLMVNLYDLGRFSFNPYFLEYFYQEGNAIFSKIDSAFEFRLYQNHRRISETQLRFRPNSVIVESTAELDPKYYYHLQISVKRNWYFVSRDCIQRMRNYPVVMYSLLRALGIKLGGGNYTDLPLVGGSLPPTIPGQCRIVGNPINGGTWPWPWLETEWNDIPWPGNTWEGTGWPGGGWEDDVPWPAEQAIPTWPGDTRFEDHQCGGTVTQKDALSVPDITDALSDNYIDNNVIGNYLVMYGEILAAKRSLIEKT